MILFKKLKAFKIQWKIIKTKLNKNLSNKNIQIILINCYNIILKNKKIWKVYVN